MANKVDPWWFVRHYDGFANSVISQRPKHVNERDDPLYGYTVSPQSQYTVTVMGMKATAACISAMTTQRDFLHKALKPFADLEAFEDGLCHKAGGINMMDCKRCGPIMRARQAIAAVEDSIYAAPSQS